jgi:ribonuclease-3
MSSLVLAEGGDLTATYGTLCSALGYYFAEYSLLDLALTHRSWCAEHDGAPSNERLEFLGDAVLGLSITDSLYHNDPSQAEGQLAKARAEVVSAPVLASIARSLDLGPLLRLGRGEELSGGRDKESILADAMEAVMAAVYLDGGWEPARLVVVGLLAAEAAKAQTNPGERDYKTRLQERAAELSMPSPQYEISSSGPDHGRMFTSTVQVATIEGRGSGTSKKQAQQRAAEQALTLLDAGRELFDSETDPVENAAVRSGGTQ